MLRPAGQRCPASPINQTFTYREKEAENNETLTNMEPKAYTLTETAELLGMSKSTLYSYARQGKIDHLRPIRLGTKTFFPRKHIDSLLE